VQPPAGTAVLPNEVGGQNTRNATEMKREKKEAWRKEEELLASRKTHPIELSTGTLPYSQNVWISRPSEACARKEKKDGHSKKGGRAFPRVQRESNRDVLTRASYVSNYATSR